MGEWVHGGLWRDVEGCGETECVIEPEVWMALLTPTMLSSLPSLPSLPVSCTACTVLRTVSLCRYDENQQPLTATEMFEDVMQVREILYRL